MSPRNTSWPDAKPPLDPISILLQKYTGEKLTVLGSIDVAVKYAYKNQQQNLQLLVIAGSRPSLIGRDWMSKIELDWKSFRLFKINAVHSQLD